MKGGAPPWVSNQRGSTSVGCRKVKGGGRPWVYNEGGSTSVGCRRVKGVGPAWVSNPMCKGGVPLWV